MRKLGGAGTTVAALKDQSKDVVPSRGQASIKRYASTTYSCHANTATNASITIETAGLPAPSTVKRDASKSPLAQ